MGIAEMTLADGRHFCPAPNANACRANSRRESRDISHSPFSFWLTNFKSAPPSLPLCVAVAGVDVVAVAVIQSDSQRDDCVAVNSRAHETKAATRQEAPSAKREKTPDETRESSAILIARNNLAQ